MTKERLTPRHPRRSARLRLLALSVLVLLIALAATGQPGFSRTRALPYQDPSKSVDDRVDDLLGRMTLMEKIGQLAQISVSVLKSSADYDRVFRGESVGSVLSGGGELPGAKNNPHDWAEGINKIQREALKRSRLKIPILYGADTIHGLSPVLGAVIFPHQIGMAATRNPRLVRRVSAVAARGAKAVGIRWVFAPIADIARDLRWGRYYETYGEDPKLASTLVAAAVRGFQGDPEHPVVAATAKAFIGYSQPDGGRDEAPAHISDSVLKEWFEPPFQAAIDAGVASIMNQHASLNGEPVVASHKLLTDLLRKQMRFKGVALSDWGDIEELDCMCHGGPSLSQNPIVASSREDAVRMALNAGLDVSMIPYDSDFFTSTLLKLVTSKSVFEERVDEAVRRVLALKFELGLFEHPYVDVDKAEARAVQASDRKLARQAVDASVTVLKNKGNLLPLKKKGGPVLVVGPAATEVSMQMGGWTIGWQGISDGATPPAVTIMQGLREMLGASTVLTADWSKPESVRSEAKKARAIVVVVGEKAYAEWYGDNAAGTLPYEQEQLIKTVEASGKPVLLVLVAGRPLMMTSFIKKADAFVMAYLPGTEAGHGVADVLFGRVRPRGTLPFSWPASITDAPMVKGVRLIDGKRMRPLFPYGAGLSYR